MTTFAESEGISAANLVETNNNNISTEIVSSPTNYSDSNNSTIGQFLFKDEEFESETFDAAAFVSRYRRVTTLESLREQLVNYSQHVKKQLYVVINRDYKDFITITTKLDGLDMRSEMLVKPLFNLQVDLSSLQNGLAVSLHSIKDKLEKQKEILRKKNAIQRVLRISSNLDSAEGSLSHDSPIPNIDAKNENNMSLQSQQQLRSRRNKLYRSCLSQFQSIEKDLFICSEYERAASALRMVQTDLEEILHESASLVDDVTISSKMIHDLIAKSNDMKANLAGNVKSHLEHYFTTASTTTATANTHSNNEVIAIEQIQRRCFTHCLRALLLIGQGYIAETALRTAVIEPYLKTSFTTSKIDGKGGRGTYSGLQTTLQELISWLRNSQIPSLLLDSVEVCPHIDSSNDKNDTNKGNHIDLLVHGIWDPVIKSLQERCPLMLSVGITSIFSSCFRAVESFTVDLLSIPYSSESTKTHDVHRNSSLAHKNIQQYRDSWKMDLYFQLRCREVMQRLDKSCELCLKTESPAELISSLYFPVASISSSAAASTAVDADNSGHLDLKNKFGLIISLSKENTDALLSQTNNYLRELYRTFELDALLCFHLSISLSPLKVKFVGLVCRLVQRLVLHIASQFNVYLSLFGTESDFESLRQRYLNPPSTGDGGKKDASKQAASASLVFSGEDFVAHLHDLFTFDKFLTSQVATQLSLIADQDSPSSSLTIGIIKSMREPLLLLTQEMWGKLTANVSADCKRPLVAVKAIAGKYRMTNKPAPTTSSTYVATIFEPLELIISRWTNQLEMIASALGSESLSSQSAGESDKIAAVTKWKESIAEEVALHFYEQVTNLFETVKQMDSALQRRSRASTANTSGSLSDSEKIYLQVRLDISDFGESLKKIGLMGTNLPSYNNLVTLSQEVTK